MQSSIVPVLAGLLVFWWLSRFREETPYDPKRSILGWAVLLVVGLLIWAVASYLAH